MVVSTSLGTALDLSDPRRQVLPPAGRSSKTGGFHVFAAGRRDHDPGMGKYLVETSVARGAFRECVSNEWRVRAAVGELRRRGLVVQLVRAVRLPDEGRCLFLFSARSGREAVLAAQEARLDGVRIVEASG
jgi:hypothetical protein